MAMGRDQEQLALVQAGMGAGGELSTEHQQQFFYFPPEEEPYAGGYNFVVDLPPRPNPLVTAVMACCPCVIGDPCGSLKRQEYKKAVKTICFFISVLQVLLFVVSLSLDGFAAVSENWLLGPTGSALVSMGAKDAYLIKTQVQVWRYVTPCFLHAGLIQLAFNLFAQLRMGLYLERTWGWYRFTLIYFVSGTAGMCLSSCLQPNSISVAASASLMGVMGGYLAQLNVTWQKLEGWQKKMHLSMCVTIIMTTFIMGVGPNYVDSTAHIGALVCGMVLGYGFFGKEKARNNRRLKVLIQFICWTIVIVFFVLAVTWFFLVIPVTDPDPDSSDGEGSEGEGEGEYGYGYGNGTIYWATNQTAVNATAQVEEGRERRGGAARGRREREEREEEAESYWTQLYDWEWFSAPWPGFRREEDKAGYGRDEGGGGGAAPPWLSLLYGSDLSLLPRLLFRRAHAFS